MKRMLALLLTGVLTCQVLTGCGTKEQAPETPAAVQTEDKKGQDENQAVTLDVTTTFAGEDGNAANFKEAVKAWEAETGNKVNDASATSDETFKARIASDFQMGSEPDVLFYFVGADANSFIEADKVVSLAEIREVYPDYASNMNEEMIPASLVDGEKYAVPLNGFWEAMYINTKVLADAGVAIPGEDYTWDQFLADCEKIKEKGYAPIAAALGSVPHYWWEFAIFNHTSPETHCQIPESADDALAQAWVAGMEDIKDLYEKGYFPENTLSATDDETFSMFMDDKAAFLIDGSWKVGGISSACQADPEDPSTLDAEKLEKISVTFVPGQGERKATDLIGGLSMGYYISRKAWDNPEKRQAAIDFVNYMTEDAMVGKFAAHTGSALKNTPPVDEAQFNSLQLKVMSMFTKVTSLTSAVQDIFDGECRESMFQVGMPKIVTGKTEAAEAVKQGIETYHSGK